MFGNHRALLAQERELEQEIKDLSAQLRRKTEALTRLSCSLHPRDPMDGRPRDRLAAEVAETILQLLEDGASINGIARTYGEAFNFSRAWLQNAVKDGRLIAMAAG